MYSSVLKCYYSNFSHPEIAGFCKLIIKLYLDITNILVIFYIACSKRSDRGVLHEVKEREKNRE